MPIYEYTCKSCHKDFEELVFGNGDNVKCPHCGSEKTAKLMSCSCFKTSDGMGGYTAPASSGSGCSGCSGGNCSTCK